MFNEILVGRFARALQKLTGIKGGPPIRQLASEIMPVLNMFYGAEHRYLESWNLFSVGIALAASVGNVNEWQLRNPTGSNVIAVIEKCMPYNDQPQTKFALSAGAQAADLTTIVAITNSRLDPRGNPTSSLTFSTQQPAAATDLANTLAFCFLGNAAGTLVYYDYIATDLQEVPLLPGDAIRLTSRTANQANAFFMRWRERALEESERT